MEQIFVRLISFPTHSTKGAIMEDEDGNYNVYLDERLSPDELRKAFIHELEHVNKDHLQQDMNIQQIEEEAGTIFSF